MSEPDLPPLPNDLASLLDAEKTRPEPAANVQDRLFSRLEASIAALPPGPGGGGAGGGDGGGHSGGGARGGEGAGGSAATAKAGGATAASVATKATLGAGLLAKPIALATATFALGSALGVAVEHATLRPEPPRTKIVYVDRVVPLAPTNARAAAPEDSVAIVPLPGSRLATRSTASGGAASSSSDAPQGHDAQLAGERSLIEIARTALSKNDTTAALDALGKHDAKYPHGQLAEEREALAVQALAGSGRTNEARARSARFKRDFPGSMLTPVVNSALE